MNIRFDHSSDVFLFPFHKMWFLKLIGAKGEKETRLEMAERKNHSHWSSKLSRVSTFLGYRVFFCYNMLCLLTN